MHRNVVRDAAAEEALCAAGWNVVTIWECATRNNQLLVEAVQAVAALPRISRKRAPD